MAFDHGDAAGVRFDGNDLLVPKFSNDFFRSRLVGRVANDDSASFYGQRLSSGSSDALRATGDECNFSFGNETCWNVDECPQIAPILEG